MNAESWGTLTPERVAEAITFERECADWAYEESDTSMPARQAEGVAGLWNKLGRYRVALLADEVGTGKTLQALGVMALLWKTKPDARVLVMAPNRDICRHWETEYGKFVRGHYRGFDDVVRRRADGEPVHRAELAGSLYDLASMAEDGQDRRLFITTIHSLSWLVRGEQEDGSDKLTLVTNAAADIRGRLKTAFGGTGFDLLIVDEAHYFRNVKGSSQRVKAASAFFGTAGGRVADRALLMTATPSHASMEDVSAILGYVTDVGKERPEALLEKFALRRLRRMKGTGGSYDKYCYRKEQVVEADFGDDPAAELFFALYQKLLVQQQAKDGRRFLYGYLEGFESFEVQKQDGEQDKEEAAKRDFQGAPDTEILKRLARMHGALGALPAHPKYDALVKGCIPRDVFDAGIDIHEHKHLVFVRRIPSVREITKRINTAYDEQMGLKIAQALAPNDTGRLKKWRNSRWSREAFNRLFKEAAENDDAGLLDDEDSPPELSDDDDADVHSRVADLFVVKKAGGQRSTLCSNFSLRLRKPTSLFSLLLEPASDFREGAYVYYHRKQSGGKSRDEYGPAALDARHDKVRGGKSIADGRSSFDGSMPTLWGLMYGLLSPDDRDKIERLARNSGMVESFGQYIKNGFLFASPVVVELYCWYVEFQVRGETGDAQRRYLAFMDFIGGKLGGSLALAYFRSALETFEAMYENWKIQREGNWRVLTGLSSPAFYASGVVKDRQRLILGFNSPFYPNVLAATSVLQEGVNLHMQCRKVHHYGIAWTPGDNEQRVGRVDRLFGKVNAELALKGKAELAIHYPYLARSFDEEQLASFIREKHFVEERMDACRQSPVSAEIDLRHVSESWRNYLRKPREGMNTMSTRDPYPYKRDEEIR